jgi:hypothetical protein
VAEKSNITRFTRVGKKNKSFLSMIFSKDLLLFLRDRNIEETESTFLRKKISIFFISFLKLQWCPELEEMKKIKFVRTLFFSEFYPILMQIPNFCSIFCVFFEFLRKFPFEITNFKTRVFFR